MQDISSYQQQKMREFWADPDRRAAALEKARLTRAANKKAKLNRSEAPANDFPDQAALNGMVHKLTGQVLYSEQEIVSASTLAPKVCGIYFLIYNGSVVYVGQSIHIWSRISQHTSARKPFDRVAFIPCDQKHLDLLESLYIHFLRPELNGAVSPNGIKSAPLSFCDLMDRLLGTINVVA
jgi:hypothetical protein